MRKRKFRFAINLTLCLLVTQFASSFPYREKEEVPAVMLGSVSGLPGETVTMPLYFYGPTAAKIAFQRLEIFFDSENLKFVNAERSPAAEKGMVSVNSAVSTKKNKRGEETSMVALDLRTPDYGCDDCMVTDSPPLFTNGVLAYVRLRISETADRELIRFRIEAEARKDRGHEKIKKLYVPGASVEVLPSGSGTL